MPERRRREDRQPWVVRYWPIVAFLAGLVSSAVIEGYRLELDVHDNARAIESLHQRMNYHFGEEW